MRRSRLYPAATRAVCYLVESLEKRTLLNDPIWDPYLDGLGTVSGQEGFSIPFQVNVSDNGGIVQRVDINWGDGSQTERVTSEFYYYYQEDRQYFYFDISHTFPDSCYGDITFTFYANNQTYTDHAYYNECYNVAPMATLQSTMEEANHTIGVSLVDAHDPSVIDTAQGFHYSFAKSYNELPSHGYNPTRYANASTSNSANFTFDTPGDHTVWAEIIDKDGGYRDYCTTITMPDLAAVTLSASTNNLTWQDVKPNSTGYRIQRSTDGQNFSIYRNLARSELTFSNGLITWTDEGLSENQRMWYRVRAVDDNGTGHETAYAPKKEVTTRLATPSDVLASVVESSGHLRVDWTNQSGGQSHVVLTRQELDENGNVVPNTSTQVTLSGDARTYEFSDTQITKTYQVTLQATNDAGNSSIYSLPSSSDVEPANDWTSVYNLDAYPPTPSYVSHVWNRGEAGSPHPVTGLPISIPAWDYGEETVTLNLSGLPQHTWAHVEMRLDAYGVFDEQNPSQLTASAGGVPMTAGASRYAYEEYWYVGIEAFQHTGSSLDITLDMTSFPEAATWHPALVWVTTYLPHVWLGGSGMAIEDGSGDGKFLANRNDPGNNTINATSLTVETVDAGGTATPDDYDPVCIDIEGGKVTGEAQVQLINDTEGEGVEEIKLLPKPSRAYALAPGTQPATTQADDDVKIKTVEFVFGSPDPNAPAYPRKVGVNGVIFWNHLFVVGEHLDKVDYMQFIKASTWMTNYDGTQADRDTINLRTLNPPQSPMANTIGEWEPDWVRQANGGAGPMERTKLVTIDGAHKAALTMFDTHSMFVFGTNTPNGIDYVYNAGTSADFKLIFYNTDTNAPIRESYWGYEWTNNSYSWTAGNGAPVGIFCASPSQNGAQSNMIHGYANGLGGDFTGFEYVPMLTLDDLKDPQQ